MPSSTALNITFKELFAVVLSVAEWGSRWQCLRLTRTLMCYLQGAICCGPVGGWVGQQMTVISLRLTRTSMLMSAIIVPFLNQITTAATLSTKVLLREHSSGLCHCSHFNFLSGQDRTGFSKDVLPWNLSHPVEVCHWTCLLEGLAFG